MILKTKIKVKLNVSPSSKYPSVDTQVREEDNSWVSKSQIVG